MDKARVTFAIAKANKNMDKYIDMLSQEDSLPKVLDWKIKRILRWTHFYVTIVFIPLPSHWQFSQYKFYFILMNSWAILKYERIYIIDADIWYQ